jgi:hypothetical protein
MRGDSVTTHRLAGAAALALLVALAACNKPGGATSASTAAASVAATAASVAPVAASGPDAADVKTFLEGLYAKYVNGPTPADNSFDPMGKDAKRVFDQSMVALLAKDAKVNGPDEVGFIDGDWLCSCQDYDKIISTVTVQSATATTAKAIVDFKVFGDAHRNAFDLVKENGAWRVHDMQDVSIKPPQPTLRAGLEADIAQMQKAAGGKKHSADEAP